jgi:hypothetical protein
MRIATVHKHRHLQLCCQRELGGKCLLLLFRRREVTVEIKPAFANGNHFWRLCQTMKRLSAFMRPLAAVMRMHACGGPAVLIALRQLPCLLTLMQIRSRQ